MKQKIVIKVQMICDKCRCKAMKQATMAEGVTSVAIEGAEKEQVVVIGDGVDSASLTCLLRKKVGNATLASVEEIVEEMEKKDEPKEEEKDPDEPKKEENPIQFPFMNVHQVVIDIRN